MSGREFYLNLARRGLKMPIGTDLVLHEEQDPEQVRRDGLALGRVIERAASRWGTPLAVPLMDLRLEKLDALKRLGVREEDADKFHFSAPIDSAMMSQLCCGEDGELCPGSRARAEAIDYIRSRPELVPVGMAIGPFSLATRLMADPVSASGLAGSGMSADDAPEVMLLEQCLRIAEAAVLRAVRSQVEHGAKAMMICEPAASTAFVSPRQLRAGSDIFERFVMTPNLRLKSYLDESGVDLIFHNCGELTSQMVEAFAYRLRPVILSLGSSRKLWEDAAFVPKDVVLYGNLPSKSFYSESAMPMEEVERLTSQLLAKMSECGHPYIAGTECDVLFVPDAKDAIRRKVDVFLATTAGKL